MKRFAFAAICCGLLIAAAGCRTNTETKFDGRGWGGPGLEYALGGQDNTITIKSGMLMNENFRWAESEFSFEFLDRRDLVWGIRLLDAVFSAARREALRNTRVKIGDRVFVLGKDLPADQMWKFDTVLDVEFTRDKKGKAYKVLDGVWYETILDSGKQGVRISATRDVRIRANAWNTFSAKVAGGKLTYSLNGEPGQGALQIDPRTDGRLGIFVGSGGPLVIRNLRLGAEPPRK
ncbi:MAG: hypothetical protein ABIF82_10935 [Planctomycetota bacterium]